jgi:4-hydroxy-tetrahydrodipicolinate synthase
VAGPDKVIAHIGAPDTRATVRLARDAVRVGAARLAAITPYYLPATPAELIAHYRAVREAAGRAELFGYLFAERTGLTVSPWLFAELAAEASLDGAKISGAAAASVAAYAGPGLQIFSGDDSNPGRSVAAGAAGVVSGRSAAWPGLFAVLRSAVNSGEDPAPYQEILGRVVASCGTIGRIKHALALRGIGTGAARMTVARPGPEEHATLVALVKEFT